MIKVDIIILSYAKDDYLKSLTQQTVATLLASENPDEIKFDVLVIESNKTLQPYQFPNTTTIYPTKKFGFNKYLNIGIKHTNNPYLCLCNNDLIFHKGWASEMLRLEKNLNDVALVLSPFCKTSHGHFHEHTEPMPGYFGYFAGHCFFTTRKTLDIIGSLDEKINFWYADQDFIELMQRHNIPHYLVPRSKVSHLISQVTITFSKLHSLRYTDYPRIYFNYKWTDKSLIKYILRLTIYYTKYGLYYTKYLFNRF